MDEIKKCIRNIAFSFHSSFLASKKYFTIKCAISAVTIVIPLANMALWRNILNDISFKGPQQKLLYGITAYLALELLLRTAGKINDYIQRRYEESMNFYFEKVTLDKTAKMELSFFDSSSMADKISRARSNFWSMEETTWTVFHLVTEIVNVIIAFSIAASYNIWIALAAVIFMVPSSVNYNRYMKNLERLEIALSGEERKIEYFESLFLNEQVHFEMKLNGTGGYFLKYYSQLKHKILRMNTKADIKYNITKSLLLMLNYCGDILVLLTSIADVIAQKTGIGDLQYHVSILSRLRSQATSFIVDFNRFMIHNERLNALREFIDIVPETEKGGTRIPSRCPRIQFDNVYFRYPNCDGYVLKGCSFTIGPYEKIGLVGHNGAGKSTIIKLMFRLYDPESGAIYIDGTDIREYDICALRRIFGVMFQEIIPYSLPLREIIAMPKFEERFDEEKLKKACDISGVSGIISDWPEGFDSILGRRYVPDGKDLSGGQWQLINYARAWFDEREYMILDEPSAALDPITEDRMFEQLYRLGEHKSLVAVSQRLSNTTLSDRILVISDGRIVEQGRHTELLARGGVYAHLFRLQAGRYE